MNVVIVHDWLYGGGAEMVVEALHEMYPEAPIYTTWATKEWRDRLDGKVRTGYLGLWPFSKLHRFTPLLQQRWFARLDFRGYDLIISSCGNGAARFAGLSRQPTTPTHVSYTHTPTHYYWRKYDEYLAWPSMRPRWLARLGLKTLVSYLRRRDFQAAQQVDFFLANSQHIAHDIKQFYGRDALVVHPPVQLDRFRNITAQPSVEPYYIVWGRHVPYKRFDLMIAATAQLGRRLVIVGEGPETDHLRRIAGDTVRFAGRVSDDELEQLAAAASAFLFPGEEDFGISPVEALAAGLPVIALERGGALDFIRDGVNGVFFKEQTADALAAALLRFETMSFDRVAISRSAVQFDTARFKQKLHDFIATV